MEQARPPQVESSVAQTYPPSDVKDGSLLETSECSTNATTLDQTLSPSRTLHMNYEGIRPAGRIFDEDGTTVLYTLKSSIE